MYNLWTDWSKIKVNYPKRKHLKLAELDKIPYYDEHNNIIDNLRCEREEQYISNDYINPDMTVLELGARYGTVSCVINNKLENPENHIVFEPDMTVLNALKMNKKSHGAKFMIVNGIISSKPKKLILEGYATKAEDAKETDKDIIKSVSLERLMKRTGLKFDCLVADCEGCLCEFFEENEKYIKDFKMIIFETDYPDECDYSNIKLKLVELNFTVLVDKFVSVWIKKGYEYKA